MPPSGTSGPPPGGAASAATGSGTSSAAPTPEQLEEARQLFADALKEEQAQRYQVALEKFQRVQRVRDTAPVRYRIATCLEGLGRLAQARAAYLAAIDAAGTDDSQAKLVQAARDRASALAPRVAYLTVKLDPPRADAEVQVDGEPVAASAVTAEEGLALDPGRHRVSATAPGAAPFQSEVSLPEGGRVTLRVPLTATPTGAAPAPVAEAPREAGRPTWAWVALGGGAAVLTGGVVALAVREADAVALQEACPNGVCNGDEEELTAQKNRAEVLGPVGVALVVVGGAAAATGAYFLLRPAPSSGTAVRTSPVIAPGFAGIHLQGGF